MTILALLSDPKGYEADGDNDWSNSRAGGCHHWKTYVMIR